jgi:ATP-dependent RNA helicase RhlE
MPFRWFLPDVTSSGIAQTGTGKTAAFALPILNRLAANRNRSRKKSPRILVLSPTRELSGQILDSFRTYGRYMRLQTALVIGGVPMGRQVRDLMNGLDVLVATPGRLHRPDALERRAASTRSRCWCSTKPTACSTWASSTTSAHRRQAARRSGQTLFFSATMPREICRSLRRSMLRRSRCVSP